MPLTFLAALIAALLVAAPATAQSVQSVRGGHDGHHPWSGWDGWDDGDDADDGSGESEDPAPEEEVEDDSPGSGWIDGDELQPPGLGEDPADELLPPAGARPVVKGREAKLGTNGAAYAPSKAPGAVKRAIWAANQLRKKPYKWGGGHRGWRDSGYDCSGSVSYVLHAAGLLDGPQVSGTFARYGKSGTGRWISIYANSGHVFMVIAGMRFDTSPYGSGARGPRWRLSARPAGGFKVRHPAGL